MNITSIDYIKELTKVLNENGLTKIDVSDTGAKVVIERGAVSSVSPIVKPRNMRQQLLTLTLYPLRQVLPPPW